MCSADRKPLAGASRFTRATHLVPDPQSDPGAFLEAVSELVSRTEADVLLPMTDVSAGLLLGLRDSHPGVKIPFPSADVYRAISDKAHLTRVAAELGIPVPDQHVVEGPEDVDLEGLGRLRFPLVLKPARSAVATAGKTLKLGVRIVWRADDLEADLHAFPPEAYPILAQQWIQGPGLGVFLLSWEGRTIASFAHRRIREKPPTGGVSVYREGVAPRPDILAHSERLLAHFQWAGAAMVEFKEDAATGVPYLMEVNGRLWGSLQLAIDAGVDFPRLLVELSTGVRVEPVVSYRLGIRSRWLWGDVDHLLGVLRATPEVRRANPELRSRARAVARFLVPWKPGDRFEVLRSSDPGPFFRETANWFRALSLGR